MNNRGPTKFLVEIDPAGVSDTLLRAVIEAHTWVDSVRVTALEEDAVIVDANALLRLADKADALYRLTQKAGDEGACEEAWELGKKIAPALNQCFKRKGQKPGT